MTIMRIKFYLVSLMLALTAGNLAAQTAPRTENIGPPVELLNEVQNSFIFVFKNSVAASDVAKQANALALANGGRVTRVYKTAIRGFAAKMPNEAAARVAAQNPNIAYYEPDAVAFTFPKPPWAGGGGSSSKACTPQETPWGVTRVGGPADGTGYTAWVIDTGIDLDNPDLDVDVARSANFVLQGKNSPNDGNGHGTHVAGTIAAIDNDCDVVGVAAGATVVAVRVLNNAGYGSYSGVIAGVDYVATNADSGDAANMSLGGPYRQSLNDAVVGAAVGKEIYFAIAAGNSSDDADKYSPASANDDHIYTVSAIDKGDVFASFSNYGNPPIDCSAPGVNVLSTKKGGGTTTMSGTSMATPHVTGILLFGPPTFDGTASNDPDNNPDPICHL
jgi:subtilisin family serine protease